MYIELHSDCFQTLNVDQAQIPSSVRDAIKDAPKPVIRKKKKLPPLNKDGKLIKRASNARTKRIEADKLMAMKKGKCGGVADKEKRSADVCDDGFGGDIDVGDNGRLRSAMDCGGDGGDNDHGLSGTAVGTSVGSDDGTYDGTSVGSNVGRNVDVELSVVDESTHTSTRTIQMIEHELQRLKNWDNQFKGYLLEKEVEEKDAD